MTIEPRLQVSVGSQGETLPPQLGQKQCGTVTQIKKDEMESLREEVSAIREQFRRARSMSEKTDRLQALIGKVPLLRGEAAKEHASHPVGSRTAGEGSLDRVISEIEDEVSEVVSRQSHVVQTEKDEPQRAEFLSIARCWLATAQPEEKYHHLWELVRYYRSINDTARTMKVLEKISPVFSPDVMKSFKTLKQNPTMDAIFAFQAANWNAIEEELTRPPQGTQTSVSDLLNHSPITKTLLKHLPYEAALALREVNKEFNDVVTRQLSPKITSLFARQAFIKEGFSLSSLPAVLRDNRLVVLAAVSRNWRNYIFASPRLQNNLTVNALAWLRAREDSPEREKEFLAAIPKEVRESQEFYVIQQKQKVIDATELSAEDLQFIAEQARKEAEVNNLLEAMGVERDKPKKSFSGKSHAFLALENFSENRGFDRDVSLIKAMAGRILPDEEGLQDREIVLETLREYSSCELMDKLASVQSPFLDDEEIARAAVRGDYSTFDSFSKRIQANPEIRAIYEQGKEMARPGLERYLHFIQSRQSLYHRTIYLWNRVKPW
jgi:hypothetical protein